MNQSKSMQKKVVIIGGGNGSAISTNAMKQFIDDIELSSVISMSDSGGSSGKLREEFDTLPPGDILRAVLAMSKYDYTVLRQIFNKNRIKGNSKSAEHSLGNLVLTLLEKYNGDYMSAVRALEDAVEAQGHVYPTTLNKTDLVVKLDNGDIIKTEGVIDRPEYDKSLRIKKAWLEPEVNIFLEAKQKIEEADCIIIGPGSLYCSVVATLLPTGTKEAIEKSKAKLIYVCGDAYEGIGETGPKKLSDFINELENYLPRKLDTIIFNNAKLSDEQKKQYAEKKWNLIEFDEENLKEHNIVAGDFEKKTGGLDPEKLGNILKELNCN